MVGLSAKMSRLGIPGILQPVPFECVPALAVCANQHAVVDVPRDEMAQYLGDGLGDADDRVF